MAEDRAFPTLTAAQIARVAAHGRRRRVARGDVLVAAGDSTVPFLVIVSGAVSMTGTAVNAGDWPGFDANAQKRHG